MRDCRSIELSPGRDATIHEARVCDVRRLVGMLPDDLGTVDLVWVLRERLPDLIDIFGACVDLPDGELINDLPIGECALLARALWDLHRDFLLPLLSVLGAPGSADASLIGPAAS